MADKRRIYFDKSEMILTVVGKKKTITVHLTSDQITRIQYDKCTERKFGIIPQDSEKIAITTPKQGQPIEFYKSKNKELFDTYKEELAEYAKTYRVTFADNTK